MAIWDIFGDGYIVWYFGGAGSICVLENNGLRPYGKSGAMDFYHFGGYQAVFRYVVINGYRGVWAIWFTSSHGEYEYYLVVATKERTEVGVWVVGVLFRVGLFGWATISWVLVSIMEVLVSLSVTISLVIPSAIAPSTGVVRTMSTGSTATGVFALSVVIVRTSSTLTHPVARLGESPVWASLVSQSVSNGRVTTGFSRLDGSLAIVAFPPCRYVFLWSVCRCQLGL